MLTVLSTEDTLTTMVHVAVELCIFAFPRAIEKCGRNRFS